MHTPYTVDTEWLCHLLRPRHCRRRRPQVSLWCGTAAVSAAQQSSTPDPSKVGPVGCRVVKNRAPDARLSWSCMDPTALTPYGRSFPMLPHGVRRCILNGGQSGGSGQSLSRIIRDPAAPLQEWWISAWLINGGHSSRWELPSVTKYVIHAGVYNREWMITYVVIELQIHVSNFIL